MTAIQFLAEWALRSSILILGGALLLRALRVKDPSIVLAAWTAMLCGSLGIPGLTAALPNMPLAFVRAAPAPLEPPVTAVYESATPAEFALPPRGDLVTPRGAARSTRLDWARIAVALYVLVAGAMLLRLCAGIATSMRFLRQSRATGRVADGIAIRESDRVACPVTLGIVRPAIVLPEDWRAWERAKLNAVVAHELSHIRRYDPAVQLLSSIHRALLWYNPLSWFLHRRIVWVAEEASDDAAVSAIEDRVSYAEVLLHFVQRGVRGANLQGVPMARYGRPDRRIDRILEATTLSRGVTRRSIAAILVLGAPLAYVVAAARPQHAAPVPPVAAPAQAAPLPAAPPPQTPPQHPTPPRKAVSPPPAEKPLTFEVASIKPYVPPPPGGGRGGGGGATGPGTADPGRIHRAAIRLKDIVLAAYDVNDFQIVGPPWLESTDESTRFTIDATLPPGTAREQLRVMWQNLLAERFKLAIHREFRELATYSLVVAKNGPKIKESAPVPAPVDGAPPSPPGPRRTGAIDPYGIPLWRMPPEGGTVRFFINGRGRLAGERVILQALADDLTGYLKSPVTDDTGLKAKYDYLLTFSVAGWNGQPLELPDGIGKADPSVASDPLPDVFGALQSQLGLKLERKKGPVEVIVIDHIEKRPTEN